MWGADNPGFVKQLFSWVNAHKRVRMMVYNQGANPNGPFRLNAHPKARAELRKALRNPRFLASVERMSWQPPPYGRRRSSRAVRRSPRSCSASAGSSCARSSARSAVVIARAGPTPRSTAPAGGSAGVTGQGGPDPGLGRRRAVRGLGICCSSRLRDRLRASGDEPRRLEPRVQFDSAAIEPLPLAAATSASNSRGCGWPGRSSVSACHCTPSTSRSPSVLDPLDRPVRRPRDRVQPAAEPVHGLVVERVHPRRVRAQDAAPAATRGPRAPCASPPSPARSGDGRSTGR